MTRKEKVKTSIPWNLHIAIVKLQASEECSYEEACVFASKILEPNSEAYREEIQRELLKHDRSQLMSSINKSKKSWTEKGRKKGYKEGYKKGYQKGSSDYKITYPCSVCGKDLVMKPSENDHVAMKQLMKERGWAHSSCIKKS